MVLKFCPKCGDILIPKRIGKEFFVVCGKCDFSKEVKGLKMKEKFEPKTKIGEGVIKEKNLLATFHNKCPKCGYDKAQIIDSGVYYSDEDNLILLKCGNCGYSERIGRKTS